VLLHDHRQIAEAKHCLARFTRTADGQMAAFQDESNDDGRFEGEIGTPDLAERSAIKRTG